MAQTAAAAPQRTQVNTDELRAAFRAARLKYIGYGFLRALESPAVRLALEAQARAARNKGKQA